MTPEMKEKAKVILESGSEEAKTKDLTDLGLSSSESAALALTTTSSNMTGEDILAIVDLMQSVGLDEDMVEETMDMVKVMAEDVDKIRVDREITEGPIRDMISDEIVGIANIAIGPTLDVLNNGNLTDAQINDLASNFETITPGHIGAIQDLLLNMSVNDEELQSLMDLVDTETLAQLAMQVDLIAETGISQQEITNIIS